MQNLTIKDNCDGLTLLYFKDHPREFKFFGDDPETKKDLIPVDTLARLREEYFIGDDQRFVDEFGRRLYFHNRCLLFPHGVWMSETAGIPTALMYKPGTHLNFRISGVTRFTSLTDNCSAICIGPDPQMEELSYFERKVTKVKKILELNPMHPRSILIFTENFSGWNKEFPAGTIIRNPGISTQIHFENPGYVVEFWDGDVSVDYYAEEYAKMYNNKMVNLITRHRH